MPYLLYEDSDAAPYGDRNYAAEDPEGHEWYFGSHVRDVSPAEMHAAGATN